MKKLIISSVLLISTLAFSQVAIGKASISTLADNVTPNPSISLEFGTGNKGLLLPWVTSAASVAGAVDGTVIYDITDKKVKYRKNGAWFDLTVDTTPLIPPLDTTLQTSLTENSNAKTAIGVNGATDATPGILVLTDTDKAMILPKIANPHLNIISPSAGMMVYDTTAKQLAVFNGTVWSFWKP